MFARSTERNDSAMREGNAVVVVGIGPGLGLAAAHRFAREGFVVVGLARTPDRVPAETRIEVHRADAADPMSLDAVLRSIERDRGPIEILIYNAYRASIGPPGSPTPDDIAADLQVNVVGAYAASQTMHSLMSPRGRGSIILTGGGLALDPRPWLDAFSLSAGKAALRNLAYSLSDAFKTSGIAVTTVTIAGRIEENTSFAPDLIAETMWHVHLAGLGAGPEVIFTGR